MLEVSVAWVRLESCQSLGFGMYRVYRGRGQERLLRIQVEVRPIDLVETPQQIFRRAIDIVAARIIRKIISQRRPAQFLFEQVNFVEKEDNAGAHEPARIHNRVEQDKTFHHSVLHAIIRDAQSNANAIKRPYLIALLQQHLIVLAESYAEND